MASGTEGIALLSMYNDEEEEDDDEQVEEPAAVSPTVDGDGEGFAVDRALPDPQDSVADGTPPGIDSLSPLPSEVATDPKTLEKSSPMPPSSRTSSPFMSVSPYPSPIPTPIPPQPPASSAMEAVDRPRARRGALAIVDYAHDEAAMSPEAEEGEIASGGRVMFGSDIQASDGNLEEGTTPGSVQILTPSTQPEPPQSSDVPEQSKSETSMAMDLTVTAPEVAQLDVAADASIDTQNDDQLNSFLPPPLTTWCSEELQEKINKFLAYKRAGKSFNADLRNRKDYRNPDFLQHAVRYQDIDQIGTCFSKEVFDPHGYDKSDYYDEIEADLKREIEKKEQEKKRSQKLDFVSVGMQSVNIAPALKVSTQIPASVTSGLQSVSTAVDSITKEIRQNKKTKWDKIDGDVKNPSNSGGHDNLSAVGVHASHLSAANAGTGYTAFAQQKRREAEEKRSGERKFDKRS